MKCLPKKYLETKERKEMWEEAKKILTKIDKTLDFSEVYVVGSFATDKKSPNDIDFAVIAKVKSKKSNISWPIDFIILPENEDKNEYLDFFREYMKKKYKKGSGMVKLK
ncbi:MAG: nucleotidyltransferase domain-containing protein [archaeon]